MATNDALDLEWLPTNPYCEIADNGKASLYVFDASLPAPGANAGGLRRGNAMSDDDLKAELERLRQENATLKKGVASGLRLKVSEKGALSVYGMGRFPVTLYKEQWLKLLNIADDIRAFIAANEGQLKAKNQD